MRTIELGTTGIRTPQNAFGALPIQRVSDDEAVTLLQRAYEGGMRYFDTARAYSDSEHKLGLAFADMREQVFIASKTTATTPDDFWRDLRTSLEELNTTYIDVYQFHMVKQCWRPDDGTGMYECMLEAKEQGLIRHIGVTAHLLSVAFELAESGLYETLQFPFSYLASDDEVRLVDTCARKGVGFVCMKGMAGGLITHSAAAMAFMDRYPTVLPIWGIQRTNELEEWLSYMDHTPTFDDEVRSFIERERTELAGDFCRGCGYCMPCTQDINIGQCARMSLMIRRAPSKQWLEEKWQTEMERIETCTACGVCQARCPYDLQIPSLLRKNLVDYRQVLAGDVQV